MRLRLTLSAMACALCFVMIAIKGEFMKPAEMIGLTDATPEIQAPMGNVTPARFVYIQFTGETSQMIQLQDVGGVLSERLSEFSVE